MALKWGAVVVAVVSVTLFVSSNIIVALLEEQDDLPVAFNLATVAAATIGVVVAVLAEMYNRVIARLNALAEFVAARLNELDAHAGDRNAGFVEGYMLSHGEEATSIVPFAGRSARRTGGIDD